MASPGVPDPPASGGLSVRTKPEPEAGRGVPEPLAQPPVEADALPQPLGGSASGSPARVWRSLGQCHWLALTDLRVHSAVPQPYTTVIAR